MSQQPTAGMSTASLVDFLDQACITLQDVRLLRFAANVVRAPLLWSFY